VKTISTKEVLLRQSEVFQRISVHALLDAIEVGEDDRLESKGSHSSTLLLDVRSFEEFQMFHLKDALCFPLINLNQDKIIVELYRFKNAAGKRIVVYDEGEAIAAQAATKLCEKGFDNCFVLTGGLKKLAKEYVHLLEGDVPERLIPKTDLKLKSPAERRERRRRSMEASLLSSPRGSSFGSSQSTISMSSTVSHQSSFARAARWKDDTQRHRELISRLHHTTK